MTRPSAIFPVVSLPAITTDQMREVDRVMIEDLHIELIQMMENAGRSLAEFVMHRYGPTSCTVLVGSGGNGGGGMVAARHLHNRGVAVTVVAKDPTPDGVPGHQLDILRRMDVPIVTDWEATPPAADVIIDAMVGYSLRGELRSPVADWIDWANSERSPTVSLDMPSGVDATTGRNGNCCITADATLTLALPKVGLRLASEAAGEVFVADISVPISVYRDMGLDIANPFVESTIVGVDGGH